MNEIARKFVTWEVPELDKLKESKVYCIKMKCVNGEKLTRDEKDWLAEKLATSSYGKSNVALQGWLFDFSKYMTRYVAKYYDTWYEYYAPDKTSLRKAVGGCVSEIWEIPKK